MSGINRKWLKDVKEGREPEKNLSEYIKKLSDNYRQSALVEVVMEYVTLYEMWIENLNPYIEVASEESKIIHDAVNRLANGATVTNMVNDFDEIRNIIIKKMQVVTAYVDRFLIYEYVLNRIEFKYTMSETQRKQELSEWNEEKYVGDLLRYIFEYKDNVVVNDRLHEVLEQLPVRMARSKFLELVKNSLKLYKDSNVYSLDGYIYMLRTSAMIYEPDEMQLYFTEFKKLLDELHDVDFNDINEEYFRILQEKICQASIKLQDISDVYMVMQKLINMLYAYALNENAADEQNTDSKRLEEHSICINVLKTLSNAFSDDAADEIDSSLLLSGLEGCMENLYDDKMLLESVLEDISIGFESIVKDMNMTKNLETCKITQNLMSTSLFAELVETGDQPVTEEYLNEVSDRLTEDLMNVIKNNKRPVIRALFASVVSKLPTFFANSQEVMDYIQNALSQCSDDVELIASIRLLDDLTEL